jgi:CTP synthase
VFSREGVDTLVLKYLHLQAKDRDLSQWEDIVHRVYNPKDEVNIGIVGKYVEYEDSYKSLKEALVHGALAHNLKLQVNWIEAEGLETDDSSFEAQIEDPAVLASAALRECCTPSVTPAKKRFRISGSV